MARYADKLLAQGERIAYRGRQHFLATLVEGRVAWAIFIAAAGARSSSSRSSTPGTADIVRQLFSWLALGLLLIGLAWLGQIYLNWYMQDYLITNRRVMKVEGVLKKRSADSSLEKINDAVLEQSVFGRMLGYGDLDILTANEQSVDRYRMLAAGADVQAHDARREAQARAGRLPDPGAAAARDRTRPGAGPAPAAPAAPAARQMSSDEITNALGDLADLRDRGAISPDEYEAKKQDLLGRL